MCVAGNESDRDYVRTVQFDGLNQGLAHIHMLCLWTARCDTWGLNTQLVSSQCEGVQTDPMIHIAV